MDLYITRHARNRMRLYEIASEDVEAALRGPDQVSPAAFGHRHAWKRRAKGGWLRVTFTDDGPRRVVITVTPKRRAPEGGHAD